MSKITFKGSVLMQSCENSDKFYLCIGDKRYIYEEGKYVGWYKP